MRIHHILTLLGIILIFLASCRKQDVVPLAPFNPQPSNPAPGPGNPNEDIHLLLGNPSNAAIRTDSLNNFLMLKGYYSLSYSRDRGTPNWVSWHLQSSDIGSVSRQDDFRSDPSIPGGWFSPASNSYYGSGFNRGHNCPSADRTSTVAANSSTFLMTNMIPQAPYLNQQTWANFENYLRSLVNGGSEIYIIMGSYGAGGTGSNGPASTISNGNITVPAHVWKVALVLPQGDNDLSRINGSTRVITISTPNRNDVSSDWRAYRTSVDAIEAATGYNIFSALPDSIQAIIEARVDNQ